MTDIQDVAAPAELETAVLTDTAEIPAPYDVKLRHADEGGWAITVGWEYGYRIDEVHHFEVHRRMKGIEGWTRVGTDIPPGERTWTDIQPGGFYAYTYTVSAISHEGERATSDEPVLPGAESGESTQYITPEPRTAKPSGIRKPLPSTSRAVFVAWDPHPQASSYRLEALDVDGQVYATARVANPKIPVGLLVADHPADLFTVRVHILRRGADGTEYDASSGDREIALDHVPEAHLTVYDLFAQEPDIAANRTHGVILALSEDKRPAPVIVNGIPHPEAWVEHEGHFSALIQYVAPMSTGITATVSVAL